MRSRTIISACLLATAVLSWWLYARFRKAPEIDFSRLTTTHVAGAPVTPQDLNGRPRIICFSASWCANCMTELAQMKQVADNILRDVPVVIISDEDPSRISAMQQRLGLPFTFLKMDKSFSDAGIHTIPATYIIGADNRIIKQQVGGLNWLDPSFGMHIHSLFRAEGLQSSIQ